MRYVYRLIGGLISTAIYFILIRNITVSVAVSWMLYLVLLGCGIFIGEKLFYRYNKDHTDKA